MNPMRGNLLPLVLAVWAALVGVLYCYYVLIPKVASHLPV